MICKEDLLCYNGMVFDNDFLTMYVDLINDNANTQKVVGKTQTHHVIPKMLTRKVGISDKQNAITVNLLYKDHFLAHYYLSRCCTKDLMYKNIYALKLISTKIKLSIEEVLTNADLLQAFYEMNAETFYNNNPMFNEKHLKNHNDIMRSESVRNKISATMKSVRLNTDDVLIHKGHTGKRVLRSELDTYLSDGWVLGSKQSQFIKINKDGKSKSIFEDEWEIYECDGWSRGSLQKLSDEHKQALVNSLYKRVDVINKDNLVVATFTSVKDATRWWFDNQEVYPLPVYRDTYHYKAIARCVKKSNDCNYYYGDIKFVYSKGGDNK